MPRNFSLDALLYSWDTINCDPILKERLVRYVATEHTQILINFVKADKALTELEAKEEAARQAETAEAAKVRFRCAGTARLSEIGKKIQVIKWFREQTGLCLKESKDWSEGIGEDYICNRERAEEMIASFKKDWNLAALESPFYV